MYRFYLFFLFLSFWGSQYKLAHAQIDSSVIIQDKIIGRIIIVGLKNTKEVIIKRELLFDSGDTIPGNEFSYRLQQSERNILNTRLFNFVTVKALPIDSTFSDVIIELVERWHLWPSLFLEVADPNFNTWLLTKDPKRLNYGLSVFTKNFRGMRERLSTYIQLGYSDQAAIFYKKPNLGEKQRWGIGFAALYEQNHEVIYGTEENKRMLFSDGLKTSRLDIQSRVSVSYRKRIFDTHELRLQHQYSILNDTLLTLRSNYYGNDKTISRYFLTQYRYVNDRRDVQAYPLNGHYINATITKYGLGLLNKNLNVFFTKVEAKKFIKISDRFFWAGLGTFKYTFSKNTPYYFQQGLGYGDFVRGYEFYVIDGEHYGLFRNNFKYKLFKKDHLILDFIPSSRFNEIHYAFYLNVFSDLGYVIDNLYKNDNFLDNTLMASGGLGVDFVTYYDKVIRFEYSFNKIGESGFFIHFVQPI